MILKGKKINLRKPAKKDAPSIHKHAKHKDISKFTANIPHPYSIKNAHVFLKKAEKEHRSKEAFHFGIEDMQTGELIGMMSLSKIDKVHKNAEVGYWVSKDYWNQGIGTEALSMILKFGFGSLKLSKIYAKVHEMNSASAKILQRTGFQLEGKLRKHHFKNGKYVDVLMYGIIKPDRK